MGQPTASTGDAYPSLDGGRFVGLGMVRSVLRVTRMVQWAASPYLDRGVRAAVYITAECVHQTWYAATRDEPRPSYL